MEVRNKMKNKLLILFVLLSCVIIAKEAYAQNVIGVSPAEVKFSDVLRGGYAERPILITLSSEEKIRMNVETRGEIMDWLNFSSSEYFVSKDDPWRLMVRLSPPRDIPNGNYTGFIRVSSQSFASTSTEGHAVGTVQAVVDILVTAEVTDKEILRCQANGFQALSVEKGDDIPYSVEITNLGNIRLKPRLSIKIWDKDQINVVKNEEFIGDEILPTTTSKMNVKIDSNDLETDQYWTDMLMLYF